MKIIWFVGFQVRLSLRVSGSLLIVVDIRGTLQVHGVVEGNLQRLFHQFNFSLTDSSPSSLGMGGGSSVCLSILSLTLSCTDLESRDGRYLLLRTEFHDQSESPQSDGFLSSLTQFSATRTSVGFPDPRRVCAICPRHSRFKFLVCNSCTLHSSTIYCS